MMDYDVEKLVEKVGGKYRLVTLMQKRMRQIRTELSRTERDINPLKIKEAVINEILEDKIYLDVNEEIGFRDR